MATAFTSYNRRRRRQQIADQIQERSRRSAQSGDHRPKRTVSPDLKEKRQWLKTLPHEELLDLFVSESRNRHRINNVVPGGQFNAYFIALKLRENGWVPTTKQRTALENVLSYYYIKYPTEAKKRNYNIY